MGIYRLFRTRIGWLTAPNPLPDGIFKEPYGRDLCGLVAPVVEEVVDLAGGRIFKVGDESCAAVDCGVGVDVWVLLWVWAFV